ISESYAAPRQGIDVWRFIKLAAIAADVFPSHVVDQDEDDIGRPRGGESGLPQQNKDERRRERKWETDGHVFAPILSARPGEENLKSQISNPFFFQFQCAAVDRSSPFTSASAPQKLLACIAQRGKRLTPIEQRLKRQLPADDVFDRSRIGDLAGLGAEDQAAAAVEEIGIFSAAIDADDIGEVFDGAGLKQRHPVFIAHDRPACDVDQNLRALLCCRTKQLGKTQVIADERSDLESLPFEKDNLIARLEMLGFSAEREGLKLLITDGRPAIGERDQRLIAP